MADTQLIRVLLPAIGILLMNSPAFSQAPLRVACVGDSITYGDKLEDRDTQAYPAVLQQLSRGRFAVSNFGVNGTTAMENTDRAWSDTVACRDAIAFAPDRVVIMLGINDLAFPDQYVRYPADLRDLVVRFQALPSTPRIFLCTLTPIAPEEQQAEVNRIIRDQMIPAIRTVASETGATLIDLHAVFPNQLDVLPDGLHPSAAGAALIARAVLAAIDAASAPPPQIRPAPVVGPVDLSVREEALAAQGRAEHWLKTQEVPADLQDPRAPWENQDLRTPDNVADLLPLLSGNSIPSATDLFYAQASLATALHRIGQETVFLADGRPVAWRTALLHQLVQHQQIDARGGGFWRNPDAPDPATDAVHSTAYALQAIATALGE